MFPLEKADAAAQCLFGFNPLRGRGKKRETRAMTLDEAEKWIREVAGEIPRFLDAMRDPDIPGRYKYSLSGDTPKAELWGLGNTVFAVKTAFAAGHPGAIDAEAAAKYIKSFAGRGGAIEDLLVARRAMFRRWAAALRSGDFGNVFGRRSKAAQTRQAFAALVALGDKPEDPFEDVPKTVPDVERFVGKLDWRRPWGAASHVNHLVFFLRWNRDLFGYGAENADESIDAAFAAAEKHRREDGSWGDGDIPAFQKINGAMKMVVAAEAAGKDSVGMEEKLASLCLEAANDAHACDNLNVVKVAARCRQSMDAETAERLRNFALERLDTYKRHYSPEHGGFSFLQEQANKVYYGAEISRGKREPDIHGTHLFTWGLALISEILELDSGFREPNPT